MSKLNNVVDVFKKAVYDKLLTKVKATDKSRFLLKTQYNTDKSSLEQKIDDADKKIRDTIWLVKKNYNAKITEIEG